MAEREQRQQEQHELLLAQEQVRFAALEKEKAEAEKTQAEYQREREILEKIRLQETITNSAHDIKSPVSGVVWLYCWVRVGIIILSHPTTSPSQPIHSHPLNPPSLHTPSHPTLSHLPSTQICALSLGVESLMTILDSERELSSEDRLKVVDTLKGKG